MVAPETSITKVVHEEKIDPNFALYAAVRPFSDYHRRLLLIRFSETTKNSSEFLAVSQTSSPPLVSVDNAPNPRWRFSLLQGSDT
jgi:hypothetical protein